MTRPLLTPEERAAIEAAVRAAESRTSGEIYCILAEESSEDVLIPLAWASGVALLAPLVALIADFRWPALVRGWQAGGADAAVRAALTETLLLQAGLFLAVMIAASLPPIRRFLTPKSFKRDRVHQAARTQFLARNLGATRDRTGVLIYVSQAEHMAELIADEGIDSKVGPEVWRNAMTALTDGLKRGAAGEGFLAAIGLCGDVLATHFPPRAEDNPNELSDAVVLLPSR